MDWTTVIAGVLSIAGLLLKAWFDKAPQRTEEKRNDETQEGRAAIAAGDVDSVSARIDSVPAKTPGNPAGLGSDEDTARRLAKITGG